MTIISRKLEKHACEYGITVTPEICACFELYAETLIRWNERINLTAITEPEEIALKHFLDSLLPLKAVEFPQNASLIDVGTGAGFPGIPLKLLRPDLRLTLLDSLNKRTIFLTEISAALKQHNAIIHGRAERVGRDPGFRESFDIAAARAVAALPALCEYCLPFIKTGGIFLALKGPGIAREAAEAKNAISLLGGEIADIKSFILPPDNERNIVIIKKISHTPSKYPRISVKIPKKPL